MRRLEEEARKASRYYFERMASFIAVPAESGVNNFVIQGPHNNPKIIHRTLMGLFERPGINASPEMPIVSLGEDKLGMVGWHKKVLGLTIPQRVKDLKLDISSEAESMFKKVLTSAGLPYAVLTVGDVQNEELVMLSCLWGADPEKVLDQFKAKSRERLRSVH